MQSREIRHMGTLVNQPGHAARSESAVPTGAPSRQAEFLAALNLHKRILYMLAFTYCYEREDRRELVQEMIAHLWQAYDRFDGRVSFATWMYRIAMNVAISHVRMQARRIRPSYLGMAIDIEDLEDLSDGPQGVVAHDNMRTLRTLIGQLDELDRGVLMLYLEGHTSQEIADVLGISTSSVTTRVNRVKQKLTQRFALE
jgi:RNA polymerase sigma factor (sigma-70 family)